MQGKALEAEAESAVYVGIDTSKAWLDVYLHPIGHASRVENSKDGLRGLARDLQKLGIAMIVIEATGKLHRLAHRMLSQAGFPVAVVNPHRSRKLADVFGQLAKTDKIDARILALFGALVHPRVTPVPAKALAELQEMVLARQGLKADETTLVNRLAAAENRFVKQILDGQLRQLRRNLRRLEARIKAVIAGDAGLQRRFDILTSIKGIGSIVAATLVGCLAELGQLSRGGIALLAGLAPLNCDSGQMRGQRHIKGGRGHVRTSLYMAAICAIRCNPDLKTVYQRLRKNGKAAKVAITAVMRKLVILANTLIREDRHWEPIHA